MIVWRGRILQDFTADEMAFDERNFAQVPLQFVPQQSRRTHQELRVVWPAGSGCPPGGCALSSIARSSGSGSIDCGGD